MAIDRVEAAGIAELARLQLSAGELDRIAEQLSQILEFAATLDQLDLGDSEPTVFPSADSPLRADEPDGRTLTSGVALAGAPEAEAGFFLVPPVVENLEP